MQISEKKRTFYNLCLMAIGMAFIGWTVENTFRLFKAGVLDSRFHILPFISPYGLIIFAFYFVIGDPDDFTFFGRRLFKEKNRKTKILSNLTTVSLIFFFVFFGELAVGNLWDALFGVELWNYSSLPLHVTQYTGLVSTLGFGIMAYVILKFIYRPVLNLLQKRMSYKIARAISCTLGVAIVLDTVRMIICMAVLNEAPMYWSISF